MTNAALLDQIRPGMEVRTADGKRLGKVRQVHQRETESYVEVIRSIWGRHLPPVSYPETVDTVAEKRVTLNVDAKTARGYTYRPRWIPEKIDDPIS